MQHHFYHTIDIKLAAILDSLGIPWRRSDPVTRVMEERNGRSFEQCTFWFDTTDENDRKAQSLYLEAYELALPLFIWKRDVRLNRKGADPDKPPHGDYYKLGEEHPIYYQMDALFLREVWLDWSRNGADLRKLIKEGDKVVNISTRASQHTKDLIKKYL